MSKTEKIRSATDSHNDWVNMETASRHRPAASLATGWLLNSNWVTGFTIQDPGTIYLEAKAVSDIHLSTGRLRNNFNGQRISAAERDSVTYLFPHPGHHHW